MRTSLRTLLLLTTDKDKVVAEMIRELTDPDRLPDSNEPYNGPPYLGFPLERPPLVDDDTRLQTFLTAFSNGGSCFDLTCSGKFIEWIVSDVNISLQETHKIKFRR